MCSSDDASYSSQYRCHLALPAVARFRGPSVGSVDSGYMHADVKTHARGWLAQFPEWSLQPYVPSATHLEARADPGVDKVSFAGLGFLTFYLAGKLRLFDTRGHTVSTRIRVLALNEVLIEARVGQGMAVARASWTRLLGSDNAYHGLPTCVPTTLLGPILTSELIIDRPLGRRAGWIRTWSWHRLLFIQTVLSTPCFWDGSYSAYDALRGNAGGI